MKVNYGQNVYDQKEINAVVKTLKKGTQMGSAVREFEKKLSKIFQKKNTLLVNSGSSALLLDFQFLNFKKNSNFINTVLTFGTTVSSLIKAGYKARFVDVEKNTFCIDVDQIEKKINKKTVAILAPDLLGNICDWIQIKKIANKYKLLVLHDSADTLGAKLNLKNVGYYTDLSITSFYGSHVINGAGNGGMLCVNDKSIFEKAKLLRSWGRSSSLNDNSEKVSNRFNIKLDGINYDNKFIFEIMGYQLEPSEISAAFALVQLKKLKKFISIRQKIFNKHIKFFSKFSQIVQCPEQNVKSSTAWLAFPLIIRKNKYFSRTDLQIYLESRNIQTRVIFTGNILKQPGFKSLNYNNNQKFKNADNVMRNGLLIGLHQGMKDYHIKHVHLSFKNFFSRYNF